MSAARKITVTPARRALLAQVHIAKKELGLDDASYRDVLSEKFNKDSAKFLSNDELRNVIAQFKSRGWKNSGNKKGKPKPRSKGYRSPSKRPMIRKIYVLWSILYKNGVAKQKRPDGYVKRMTKTHARPDGIGNVEWLDDGDAHAIIESLKKWIARAELSHLIAGR